MKPRKLSLDAGDITGLGQMSQALQGCAHLIDEDLALRYAVLESTLLENAARLELDEDIEHLKGFARSVGCELMSADAQTRCFPHTCWKPGPWDHFPPFYVKSEGRNSSSSEVLPAPQQGAAMVWVVLTILEKDPAQTVDAKALLAYQIRNGIYILNGMTGMD